MLPALWHVDDLTRPCLSSSPTEYQPRPFSHLHLFPVWMTCTWTTPSDRDAVTALTPTEVQTHHCLSLQMHTSAYVGSLFSFSFPGNLSPCKKTNGYLFNCYPQMRIYPSSSPHDHFPSKVSSRPEFSPHTPLSLFLHLSFSLSFPLFLIYFSLCSHRHTHISSQAHRLSGYPVGRGLRILLTTAMFRGSLLYFALDFSPASHSYSHRHTVTKDWLIGFK